jgi:hypothetical protein
MAEVIRNDMPEPIDHNNDGTGDPDKRPIDFTQFRVLPKERATVGVGELPSEERLRQNRQIDAHLGLENPSSFTRADEEAIKAAETTADLVEEAYRASARKDVIPLEPRPLPGSDVPRINKWDKVFRFFFPPRESKVRS